MLECAIDQIRVVLRPDVLETSSISHWLTGEIHCTSINDRCVVGFAAIQWDCAVA